jgi:outer membrane PBP1 activator LpoA protein
MPANATSRLMWLLAACAFAGCSVQMGRELTNALQPSNLNAE